MGPADRHRPIRGQIEIEGRRADDCLHGIGRRVRLPNHGQNLFYRATFNGRYASGMLVQRQQGRFGVNNIIYIVGLVVVVIAVLSFFGLR